MNTAGFSALEIILGLVLINGVLFASVYGIMYMLRKKAREALEQAREAIQPLTHQSEDVQGFLQSYQNAAADDPYQAEIRTLTATQEEISTRLAQMESAIQVVDWDFASQGNNQLRRIINAPYRWYIRLRETDDLLAEGDAIQARLEEANAQAKQINLIPWQVAVKIRQGTTQINEIETLATALKERGAQGNTLREIFARIPVWRKSLQEIPASFHQDEQTQLLRTVTPQETIEAYSRVSAVRAGIERSLAPLRELDQHHQTAKSELATARQSVEGTRQALQQPVAGLKPDPLSQQLEKVLEMLADIEARMKNPEVEAVKRLHREAARSRKMAEDVRQELDQATQQASQLEREMLEMSKWLNTINNQFTSLEEKEYPLAWGESSQALVKLRQRIKNLGEVSQPRTPEQIRAALQEAEKIRVEEQRMVEQYLQASAQYRDLTSLLQKQDIQQGAVWAAATRERLSQAAEYDPRNWVKPNLIDSLFANLDAIDALQIRLLPHGQPLPLHESTLPERLADMKQLAQLHETAHASADELNTRLTEIQQMEEQARRLLKQGWNAVENATLLADSNDLLHELASAQIPQLQTEMQTLGESLHQPERGAVQKKLQLVQTKNDALCQTFADWVGAIHAQNLAIAKQLSNLLGNLSNIAILEDPVFRDAHTLIENENLTPAAPSLRSNIAQKVRLKATPLFTFHTAQEANAELKIKNDLWLALNAVWDTLQERSETLLQAYQETMKLREQAQGNLAEITLQVSPRQKMWPPCNQAAIPETPLASADHTLAALRKQHLNSEKVILELGRLALQYNIAVERTRSLLERIQQDRDEISDLENQINDIKQSWNAKRLSMPNNVLFGSGVHQLTAQTDANMATIHQQYIQGLVTYGGVLAAVRKVYEDISTARISIDDSHEIGLTSPNARASRKI